MKQDPVDKTRLGPESWEPGSAFVPAGSSDASTSSETSAPGASVSEDREAVAGEAGVVLAPVASPLDVDTLGTDASPSDFHRSAFPALSDPPSPTTLASGPQLGRYVLREELGRGGMGVVYRAFDPQLERDVALKFLGLAGSRSAQGRLRFQREARVVARLDHPHIVRVYDIGQYEGYDYFVMRLVRGPSLAKRLEQGPLPPDQAVRIARQVALALQYAHGQGLVHRDVKPANILLEGGEIPVLTDFGVVKDLSEASPLLTVDGRLIGTPAYMAPEQLRGGGGSVGPSADQYALGVVLFEMLSGKRPPRAASPARELPDAPPGDLPATPQGDGKTLSARSTSSKLPPPLLRICQKAMAESPPDRYPSLAELVLDLERYQRGEPVLARPPGLWRRLLLWGQARPVSQAAAWMGLGLLVVAAVITALSHALEVRRLSQLEAAAEDRLQATDARIDALLAKGRTSEADAAFLAFSELPENQGTRAEARGWLTQAERLHKRQDTEGQRQALAAAYSTARDDQERRDTFLGLAQLLRLEWSWDALEELLKTAIERMPALRTQPALIQLGAEAAFARRDFQTVRDAPEGQVPASVRRLAASFAQATRTEQYYDSDLPRVIVDPTDGTRVLGLFYRQDTDHRGRSRQQGGSQDGGSQDGGSQAPKHRLVSLKTPDLPLVTPLVFGDAPGGINQTFALKSGPGQPASLAVWQGNIHTAAIYRLKGATLEPLHRWLTDSFGKVLAADLEGDGRLEIYAGTLAYQRDLQVLKQLPSGQFERADAHPPTSLAASDIMSLKETDLDHDGKPELAVAATAWTAYDVRLLEAGPTGGLQLTARRKMGVVSDLGVLHGEARDRLVALKSDLYANPSMFSAAKPFGEPPGVYVLRREGRELVVEQFMPLPSHAWFQELMVADLDGDGLEDLIALMRRTDATQSIVFLQQPDGGFFELTLKGVDPLATANMDDDPAQELVVALNDDSRRLWVLGIGGDRTPILERQEPVRSLPPPSHPAVADAWLKAEDLAAIGLVDAAVARFQQISEQTLRPETIAAALVRGADLLRASNHPNQAARLYERASEKATLVGGGHIEAMEAAAQTWRSINHFDDALRMVEKLLNETAPGSSETAPGSSGTHPSVDARTRWQKEREFLQAQLHPRQNWRTDFSEPLSSDWRFLESGGLRWLQATGGLSLDLIDRSPRIGIARRPLRVASGPLTLEVDLTAERLEWGGGISIDLRSSEGQLFGVTAQGWGGKNNFNVMVGCHSNSLMPGAMFRIDSPELLRRYHIRLDVLEDGSQRCMVTHAESGELLKEMRFSDRPPVPGTWHLELNDTYASWAGPMRARATLHSVRLLGAEPLAPLTPETPWDQALRALANGDSLAALTLLDGAAASGAPPIERHLSRARALQDLGRTLDAENALRAAIDAGLARDPAFRERLLALVREQPEQLNPLLQKAAGWDAWMGIFVEAWRAVANMHPSDPVVRNTLSLSLGAETQTRKPQGDTLPFVELLESRAEGLKLSSQWGAARADLWRSLELLEGESSAAKGDAERLLGVKKRRALIHIRLAEVELAAGNREGAMTHVQQALEHSALPEITADALKASPELRPLHTHPAWAKRVGTP